MKSIMLSFFLAAFAFSPSIACAQLPSALASIPGTNPKDAFDKLLDQQVGKLLGEELPVTLNAKTAYPTVSESALPGGAFSGKPLKLAPDNLLKPLPPGDYTISMTFFCTEYGQHQPNNGSAYILGPAQGKLSTPVATLLWRGMMVGKTPQELQMVSWAIQSSVPYSKMPPQYQKTIDQLLPEFKGQLDGQGLAKITNGYESFVAGNIAKYNTISNIAGTAAKVGGFFGMGGIASKITPPKIQAPTLDTVLARLGPLGRMALDGKRQATLLSANYISDEVRQQTVFAGQGSQLPPETGASSPWSVKVPGRVYMRFVVKGGNLGTDNEMQIRVLPAAPVVSTNDMAMRPHFQLASYQVAVVPVAAPSLLGLFGGVADEALFARCITAGPAFPECIALSVTVAGMVSYATGSPRQAPIMAPSLPITSAMTGGGATENNEKAKEDEGKDDKEENSPTYEGNPKHGKQQVGPVSKEPENGQKALDDSVQIKKTSPRRIGVDPENNEIVVLDQTNKVQNTWHGHVRAWDKLEPEMQNALRKAGLVDKNGKILLE